LIKSSLGAQLLFLLQVIKHAKNMHVGSAKGCGAHVSCRTVNRRRVT
jgi:hypothetical protein